MLKKSVILSGHATSIAIEPEFWAAFCTICEKMGQSKRQVLIEIDNTRKSTNLSSAVRVFVLNYLLGKIPQ